MPLHEHVIGRARVPPDGYLPNKRIGRVPSFVSIGEMEMVAADIGVRAFGHEKRFARTGNGGDAGIIGQPAARIRREQEIVNGITVQPGLMWVAVAAPEVCTAAVRLQSADPRFAGVLRTRQGLLVVVSI